MLQTLSTASFVGNVLKTMKISKPVYKDSGEKGLQLYKWLFRPSNSLWCCISSCCTIWRRAGRDRGLVILLKFPNEQKL